MSIGPKSRTVRPGKTKIGTEVAHVARDSDISFKVKRSKVKVTMPLYSLRRLHIMQLQRSLWERIGRGNLLLRCRLQARRSARRREALRCPQREERGRGISLRPPAGAYSLFVIWRCDNIESKNVSLQFREMSTLNVGDICRQM